MAVLAFDAPLDTIREWIDAYEVPLRIMSAGTSIEIYKEQGLPSEFIDRFDLSRLSGSHGLGHTRMATESAVTTQHSHPFSTGRDLCLVHNGSLFEPQPAAAGAGPARHQIPDR